MQLCLGKADMTGGVTSRTKTASSLRPTTVYSALSISVLGVVQYGLNQATKHSRQNIAAAAASDCT